MKLRSWAIAALTVGALVAGGGRVQAKQSASAGGHAEPAAAEPGHMAEELEHSELGSYNNCDPCAPSCSGGGGMGMGGFLSRPIQLVFGAEYIYAKANFSQALSYVEQDLIAGGETWHCYDFDYNSSYSFYGGIYLCDCGGSIIFDYTRMTSDATTSANSTNDVNIFGPFEIDDNIEGFADVDLRSYDLSFAKTIPLGCPLQCGKDCGDCCDECCDDSCCGNGCCGGWCPAWDITWSAGVRYAEAEWGRGLTAFDPLNNNAVIDSYNTRFDWNGFGGRVGLMGRRYIGRRGLVSLYGKGDWSVLAGEYDITTTVTNAAGSAFLRSECDNVVPVTEIELGGTVHIGCHASLSAGYFWTAWHDLGMREEYAYDQFQISHYDDANILGFDGLFARAEVAF